MARKRERRQEVAVVASVPAVCAALRDARKGAGMTQVELANCMGVGQTQIVRWETTREPSLDTLSAAEQCLGLDHGQLLRMAGYVAAQDGELTTEEMIAKDPRLSRVARDMVLGAYRSVAKNLP